MAGNRSAFRKMKIIRTEKYRIKRKFYDTKTNEIYDSISDIPGPKELNFDVVPIFIWLGYIPGNDTLFKEIQCLPAGSEIVLDENGWIVRRRFCYEKPINKEGYSNLSAEELIEEGKKGWLEVIGKLYKPNSDIVVPISGGLDSRAILASLLEYTDASNIETYTYGTPKTFDFEIGNSICSFAGTKHTSFDLSDMEITTKILEKACILTHGNVNLFLSVFQALINETYGHETEYWSGLYGG